MSFVKGSNSALSSSSFFFLIFILNVQTFLGSRLELLSVKLFQLLHGILVDWIHHVQDFESLFPEVLQERGR